MRVITSVLHIYSPHRLYQEAEYSDHSQVLPRLAWYRNSARGSKGAERASHVCELGLYRDVNNFVLCDSAGTIFIRADYGGPQIPPVLLDIYPGPEVFAQGYLTTKA